MPNLMWTWQQGVIVALVLWATWGVLGWRRPGHAVRPFLREGALVVALYALWQFAGALSGSGTYAAVGRARWIWDTERSVHLPSERTLQDWILPHPLMVQAANLYYATMHFTALIVLLIWLFARHRDVYARWRTTVAVFTAASLLVQLIAVAPPRMVPGLGIVDTAQRYGQSVYGSVGGFQADQLSAMPSVHIGWAVLVAVCVCTVSRSRWRFAVIGHAVATVLVVVATGNHFWADGIVAVALLALAIFVHPLALAVARPSWIRRNPDNLDSDEQLKLKEVLAACPHLDTLHGHVKAFARMMTDRQGQDLDAWIAAARADDLPTCTPSPTAWNATTPPSSTA